MTAVRHACIEAGMHVCMHIHACMHIQADMKSGMYADRQACMYADCGDMHARLWRHACMYAGRQACTEASRQTGMQTCSPSMHACITRLANEGNQELTTKLKAVTRLYKILLFYYHIILS